MFSNSLTEYCGRSEIKRLIQSKHLESALSFREACDNHLSVINVLTRIDDVRTMTD